MTSSIFSRLGYNFTDTNSDIIEFSDKVVSHLNALPTLVNTWQQEDIATSNTGGYFVNPLESITTNIRNTSNTIIPLLSSAAQTSALQGSTGTITSLFASMNANLISISGNTGNNFIAHTDRISGVAPFSSTEDPSEFPYYKIAIATGKVMVYLTHQSDGITNSAPILGSFTSLFVGDELQTVLDTVSTYTNTINTSITYTTTLLGTPPNTYIYTTKTSNLSLATVQAMNNNVSYIIDTMNTRRTHDETFYQNSRAVLDDYNTVRQFSNMGETQDQLIQNYIGSDKLLSRVNG
jgi:hypothetical protein